MVYSRSGESAALGPNAARVNIWYGRIIIFVTEFRVQKRVKTKHHDKQVLGKSWEASIRHT